MGGTLWDQVGRPLLFGLAIHVGVAALWLLCVRLCNCLTQQIKTGTPAAVGESAHDRPLFESSGATAHANCAPDLEMGNGSGPAEGGESIAGPEMELGIVKSGVQRGIRMKRLLGKSVDVGYDCCTAPEADSAEAL